MLQDNTKIMNLQTDRSGNREIEIEEVPSPVNKIISTKPNMTEDSPESIEETKPYQNEERSITMMNLATTEDIIADGTSENRSAALS